MFNVVSFRKKIVGFNFYRNVKKKVPNGFFLVEVPNGFETKTFIQYKKTFRSRKPKLVIFFFIKISHRFFGKEISHRLCKTVIKQVNIHESDYKNGLNE